jgi:NADH:ubiquinone oxidoreductase subunit 5 (subunit L)/multisubunit Na+/H+ antiporter MnhA subunit
LVGLAFFHLLTHALFKALLFMCAGVIIHTIKDSQDIRFMGNLSIQIPFTSVCLTVKNLGLCHGLGLTPRLTDRVIVSRNEILTMS